MTLDQLPVHQLAAIAQIDGEMLGESASRRIRALGFEPGMRVELLRRGGVLAVRIGRMTVAIRAAQARAIAVELA